MKIDQQNINIIIDKLKNLNIKERIKFLLQDNKIFFSTSFGIEDQYLTHIIAENNFKVDIFTLDTGRLHEETYKTWQSTVNKYKIKINAYYPHRAEIGEFVNEFGINSFYESKDLRLKCCGIRKVQPLEDAIDNYKNSGFNIWISGLRAEQSKERAEKQIIEYAPSHNIYKFYPLLDVKEVEIIDIVKKNTIVYNELYDRGFKSIGCEPCTRAILEGEDPRAGRWWWEEADQKECGLHMVNGKLTRIKKD